MKLFYRTQVYGLVWDLHKVGIIHGDLKAQNVTHVPGGFQLINFSESQMHSCLETWYGIPLLHSLNI
jgi:tRNA A-37 threonylcarbamoyl transferase component Bud32